MSDRKLGYIILFFLLVFFSITILFFIDRTTREHHLFSVHFEQIGELNIQDPVIIDGIRAGQVKSISSAKDAITVKLNLLNDYDIHEGYSVSLKSKGVMGERFIHIDPGPQHAPLVKEGKALKGTFEMGPPEALAYVQDLYKLVKTLSDISTTLYKGSQDKNSFIQQYETAVSSIDSLSNNLVSIVEVMDEGFNQVVDNFYSLLNVAKSVSDTLTDYLPDIVRVIDELVEKLDGTLRQIDNLITLNTSALEPLLDSTSFLWGDQLEKLKEQVVSVREAVVFIRSGRLILPVKRAGRK